MYSTGREEKNEGNVVGRSIKEAWKNVGRCEEAKIGCRNGRKYERCG